MSYKSMKNINDNKVGKEYQKKYTKNTHAFECKNMLHLADTFNENLQQGNVFLYI